MSIHVTFKHMETSPSTDEYVRTKMDHLVQKYASGRDVDSSIVLGTEKHEFICNMTVNVDGKTLQAKDQTDDMRTSIDHCLGKLERQLHDYKEKSVRH